MNLIISRRYLLSGCVFFLGVVVLLAVTGTAHRMLEDVTFALHPSAGRAYELGDAHFRARDVASYDVDRARYWYERSLTMDPEFPGAHHQLARIAFLKGNFKKAMNLIDAEINLPHGPVTPSSYYIRGLIEGYMGEYVASAKDYEKYLESDPHNWAAMNDYAWVLLRAERFVDAEKVTRRGLDSFPDNPWLLNSHATALFELGKSQTALADVRRADLLLSNLTEAQWLTAYPGNDPQVAGQGIDTFKKAVENNMHTIEMKISTTTVQ